jgi:hypothetical protein
MMVYVHHYLQSVGRHKHDRGTFSMRCKALIILDVEYVWFAKMTWRTMSVKKI